MARKAGLVTAGLAGALGCGVAATIAGLGVMALVVVGGLALASSTLDGCDLELDGLSPQQLALTRNLDGTIQARTEPCAGALPVTSIVLRRVDGPVLWSARMTDGPAESLSSVTFGRAPDGYEEDVALDWAVLDDGRDYEVVLSPLDLHAVTDAAPTTLPPYALFGASTATFRPEQVHVGRVRWGGDELSVAEFARRSCR